MTCCSRDRDSIRRSCGAFRDRYQYTVRTEHTAKTVGGRIKEKRKDAGEGIGKWKEKRTSTRDAAIYISALTPDSFLDHPDLSVTQESKYCVGEFLTVS